MNIEDVAMGCLGIAFMLLIAGLVVAGGLALVDSLHYDRASFAAQTACMAKRGVPQRKWLSTEVVCVPANTRQDTTTVQIKQ